MTNNPIDPKKKIAPDQESNQLSNDELEQVAGGTLREIGKEIVEGVKETGEAIKDTAVDVKKALF